jgi:hypothetical protein
MEFYERKERKPIDVLTSPSRTSLSTRDEEYERPWWERVFAPFQAPQETLFKFTQNVAADGFQLKDVVDALGHGARYFNPWSNVESIDPDEIQRIFFGDEEVSGGKRLFRNVAISLLYDPLLFAAPLKALSAAAGAQKGVTKAISVVANPAEGVIDLMRTASERVVAPIATDAARAVLGKETADKWGTVIAQSLFKRYAGVPEEAQDLLKQMNAESNRLRSDLAHGLKLANKLGGPKVQELLSDALESAAFFAVRSGDEVDNVGRLEYDKIKKRMEWMGVDEDLFFLTYDKFRGIDDGIGKMLVDVGHIDVKSFDEYRGKHLRRIYMAHEKPQEYLDRLERLSETHPHLKDSFMSFNKKHFAEAMDEVTERIDGGLSGGQRPLFGSANRYMRTGNEVGFNTRRFVEDVDDWVQKNPQATVDQVFDHVKTNLLNDVAMPEEALAAVGNFLSGSFQEVKGIKWYQDKLRANMYGSNLGWRTLAERIEVVSARENIPDAIRQALGEVLEAGPRMVSQVTEAGDLVSMTRLFDSISGTRRVDEKMWEHVAKVQETLRKGGNAAEELEALTKIAGREFTPEEVMALERGSIWQFQGGTNIASVEKTDTHTMYINNDPMFGSLAGMWVSPGLGVLLRARNISTQIDNPSADNMALMALQLARKATGWFKAAKVLYDPAGQSRNFLGNAFLMDVGGMNPLDVKSIMTAVSELRQYAKTGDMGTYLKYAFDAGVDIFANTFTRAELDIIASSVGTSSRNEDVLGVLESIYNAIKSGGRNAHDMAAATFEFNEKMFKMTAFIQTHQSLVAKLRTVPTEGVLRDVAKQAAAKAEYALFNYGDVPYLVEFARKYGVVPFATFPYKAIPFVADALYNRPWRVLKYNRGAEEVNNSLPGGAEEARKQIEGLDSHLRDSMVVRMPWKDHQGRAQYVDMTYFLPWGAIDDLLKVGKPVRETQYRGGMLNFPALAFVDIFRTNRDGLGREIIKATDSPEVRWRKYGDAILDFWLPPSFPGGSRGESIGKALQAAAASSPDEAKKALHNLGGFMRSPLGLQDWDTLPVQNRRGLDPQSQASVIQESPAGTLGHALGSAIFGGTHASDGMQQYQNARGAFQVSQTDLAREIARVRADRTMPYDKKMDELLRLQKQRVWKKQSHYDRVSRML